MKSWSLIDSKFSETPKEISRFLMELKELYIKYNLSISHEDNQGGFIIERFSEDNLDWILSADLNIENKINQ